MATIRRYGQYSTIVEPAGTKFNNIGDAAMVLRDCGYITYSGYGELWLVCVDGNRVYEGVKKIVGQYTSFIHDDGKQFISRYNLMKLAKKLNDSRETIKLLA
jgi:hypothetical protein